MRIGVSIGPEIERIEEISKEFDFVELSIGERERNLEDIDVEELRQKLDSKNFGIIVHLPFRQPIATTVSEYNRAKIDYTDRLLEFASRIGAEKAVMHANLRWGEEKSGLREKVRRQVSRVAEIGEKKGVEVCFENLPFEETKPMDLEEFCEMLREEEVSMCFDNGHAVVEAPHEKARDIAEEYIDIISHLHIQDTRNREDSHLSLGDGEIDFEKLGDSLSGFEGTATLEIYTEDREQLELSRRKLERHF